MSIYSVSIYCPYCRRYTNLTPAKATTQRHLGVPYGFEDVKYPCAWKRMDNDVWWIGICNACIKPVLVHNNGDIIYPNSLPSPSDKRIPEIIRRDLDEAKICYVAGAYRACAVMARRAIESACIDKGASKDKRLIDKLQELADEGIITNELKQWADVVRWIGNDAAHPGSDQVSKDEAEDILTLAEQFLHVIYVTPSIARERREKRNLKKK
jgi:hypothetical protein